MKGKDPWTRTPEAPHLRQRAADEWDLGPAQRTVFLSHVCFKTKQKNTKDFDKEVQHQPFFSQLIRDAAKRIFQITSLQTFSKYLVVYVYLNGPILSVPSPCPSVEPSVLLWCWFRSLFQQNNSGTSLGLLCFRRFLLVGPELWQTFCSSTAPLLEGHRNCRCLDICGGRTSAFVGWTRQQQCFPACTREGDFGSLTNLSLRLSLLPSTSSHFFSVCVYHFSIVWSVGASWVHDDTTSSRQGVKLGLMHAIGSSLGSVNSDSAVFSG